MDRAGRLGLLAVVLAAGPARADSLDTAPPVTGTNYAIDFYDGVALGNTAQIGMGGAGAALVVGSAGTLLNASAPAVRQTTDTDAWSWDYHLDFLTATYSSDYDNNGHRVVDGSGPTLLTLGLGARYHDWAAAVTLSGQLLPIDDGDLDPGTSLRADALRAKLVLAKWVPGLDIAFGAGVQTVTFDLIKNGATLFQITGTGIVAGATWIPHLQSYRAGASLESAIDGGQVKGDCDPMMCVGLILPNHIQSPARIVIGGAYRLSGTAWNQLVHRVFRDEPSLTIAADVLVTGPSSNGYGVEGFGAQVLQRSGRREAISVRGGAEYEWIPGRLRVRAGSYWEPGRFDGLRGRLHGTFGVDVRVLELDVWGLRRGRIGLTGDVAREYRNVGVSVGFWH